MGPALIAAGVGGALAQLALLNPHALHDRHQHG
jgi:hypothetical protein